MIVCGKCGFTQPRDVYCANCGINLEKYRPEKPPAWVRLAKDPISQITMTIIAAVAVFFIFLNNSQKDNIGNEAAAYDSQEEVVEESIADAAEAAPTPKNKIVKKIRNASKEKIKEVQKQFAKKVTSAELPPPKEDEGEEAEEEETEVVDYDLTGNIQFFEITPIQLEKYFTGNAMVQASVLETAEIDLQIGNLSKIPIERTWNLKNEDNQTFDYMLEPIDGTEAQGIKIMAKNNSPTEEATKNISLSVTANIPSQEGNSASIEWSRSFDVEKGKTVLVKIRLPEKDIPASFIEENYNSLLSIMANPQYAEQKLQLLMYLKF